MIGVGVAVVLILFALKDYLMKNVFAKKEEVEEEPEDMAEKESEDEDSDLDGDLKKWIWKNKFIVNYIYVVGVFIVIFWRSISF